MLKFIKANPILFGISFIMISVGVVCFYIATIVDPTAMTDDGMITQRLLFYILGASFAGGTVILDIIILLFLHNKSIVTKKLLEKGHKGTAKVLSSSETGLLINDQPQMKISLDITLDGFERFKVEKKLVIPISKLSQIETGREISVLADPDDHKNPKKIALLFK